MAVGGYLDLCGTAVTALPDALTVGGDLYLSRTAIAALPDALTVGGRLLLGPRPQMRFPTGWFVNERGGRRWRTLVSDGTYTLIESDAGRLVAGCRGPWSHVEALAHWDAAARTDKRAQRFAAALQQLP